MLFAINSPRVVLYADPVFQVATLKGSGVRINCISPGQIDCGVNLESLDRKGQTHQLPPSSLQSKDVQKQLIGLERAGLPYEVARVAGFLASDFSSYMVSSQGCFLDHTVTDSNFRPERTWWWMEEARS